MKNASLDGVCVVGGLWVGGVFSVRIFPVMK